MLIIAGWVAACGGLLAVAGVSKLYRGARGMTGQTAVLRALRVPPRWGRAAETAAGLAECAAGAAVIAGVTGAAAVMTGLGVVFCAVLGYVRARRIPGGCGCIQWRIRGGRAVQTVSWADVARSALVLSGGISGLAAAGGGGLAFSRGWFDAGAAAGVCAAVLASLPVPWRTPVCHRPLWRPQRAALRRLTEHGVFQAMSQSAGPFGPLVRRGRAGCTEEYWFARAERPAEPAVLFQVRRSAGDDELTVRASLLTTVR